MEEKESKQKEREIYVEPKVIATYDKAELEETIKPQGIIPSPDGEGMT